MDWCCFTTTVVPVYGNCWIMAWTTDWSPEASTQSAAGAQVKAIHLCDQKGWSLAPPLLDPPPPFKGWLPLRKDLFLEVAPLRVVVFFWCFFFLFVCFCLFFVCFVFYFNCKPRTWVSTYFGLSLSTMIIFLVIQPVKYQLNHTTLLIVYLLIVQPGTLSECGALMFH